MKKESTWSLLDLATLDECTAKQAPEMGLSESRNEYDLPSLVSLPNVLSEAPTREV